MDRGESQGIIGQMRVAAIEKGGGTLAKFFCGFCCEYEVFCEEKKRIENRIEERKKSGWVDRERREKETINANESPPRDDEWPCPAPRHLPRTPVTGVS